MKTKLASWTRAHFAVDMSCFYIFYKGVDSLYHANEDSLPILGLAVLTYNCLAFGLQMVIGSIADKHPSVEKAIGKVGLAFMVIPLALIWISQSEVVSWISLILCALLNASFHVGGGMDVLKESHGKVAPSGIFVSSGALGVITGTLYGQSEHNALLPIGIVILSSILLFLSASRPPVVSKNEEQQVSTIKLTKLGIGAVCACLFIAVLIRSFAGFIWPIKVQLTGLLVLLPSVSSCLGKAFGGIIADKLGALETAALALVLSLVLLFVSNGSWLLTGMSILFFNMAMPITLCGLAAAMPDNYGFAFGLSTFALLLGYVAYYPLAINGFSNRYTIITITILGLAAILLIALSLKTKKSIHHVGKHL